jgi:hypothetical protein
VDFAPNGLFLAVGVGGGTPKDGSVLVVSLMEEALRITQRKQVRSILISVWRAGGVEESVREGGVGVSLCMLCPSYDCREPHGGGAAHHTEEAGV